MEALFYQTQDLNLPAIAQDKMVIRKLACPMGKQLRYIIR